VSGVPAGLPVSIISIAVPGVGQGTEGQGSSVLVQELTATSVVHTLVRDRIENFIRARWFNLPNHTPSQRVTSRLRFAQFAY
jgi:hypothetical protein